MNVTPEVIERERRFYNESHGRYRRWRLLIWRAIGAFNRDAELRHLYDPRDKRVLLYGCGPANEAGGLIRAGARSVTGIDISDGEIEQAWRQARELGLGDRVEFRVADAHHTGFDDDSFDLIIGHGILHHLEIRTALLELRRILAPGGRAVLGEPLAHNPLLRLGRFLTPAARTTDEHPLTVADWELCTRVFPGFHHREVELVSIPLMPLNLVLPRRWQEAIARRVLKFDDYLLGRYPGLRRHARATHMVLES